MAGSSAPPLTPYGWRGQRRMPWRLQARFSVVAQMPSAAAASCGCHKAIRTSALYPLPMARSFPSAVRVRMRSDAASTAWREHEYRRCAKPNPVRFASREAARHGHDSPVVHIPQLHATLSVRWQLQVLRNRSLSTTFS